ncbi:MAG: transporter substrate-binding domain-containing protein [Sedimenticola sp.]
MKRHDAYLLLLALFLLLSPGAVLSQEKIRIQFKWFHQFQFAGYYAAVEQGYYADEGLEVELLERNPETSHVDDVVEGRAEYGVADAGLMLARIRGKPVVLLKQIFQHSPLVFLTLKESGLRNPQQLGGKRVMVDSAGYSDAPLNALLLEALGSLDAAEIVAQSYRREDLLEKKVDAMVAYITDQPFWFRENGHDVNILDPRDYGIDFYGDNLFTSEHEFREHPERVERVIRATLKGWQYALEHQDELVDLILAKYNTQGFSRQHLLYEARMTAKMVALGVRELGSVERSRLEKIAGIYVELGKADRISIAPSFIYDERIPSLDLTREERAYLQDLGLLKVPFIEYQPPLTFSKEGVPSGYLNELLEQVAELLGIEFEWVRGLSYGESLQVLKEGRVDLLNDYSSFGDRRAFVLPSRPILRAPFVAVGRSGSPPVRSVDDLGGKRLVLVSGFQQTRTIQQRYPHLDLLVVDSIDRAYRALRARDADYYIDNATHAGYLLRERMVNDLVIAGELPPGEMGELELRYAIAAEQPLLHSVIEKALDAIGSRGLSSLKEKWLYTTAQRETSAQPEPFRLNEQERAWLEEHKVIRLALDPAWAPVEYINEQGEFEGISLDYLKRLEKMLGVRFEPSHGMSWQEVVAGVRSKSLDMFASVSRTPQRAAYARFTRPYVSMPISIFARNDVSYIGNLQNLEGKRVAVVDGYAIHDWLVNDYPGIELLPVASPREGLERVDAGEVDAYVGNLVVASYYIGKLKLSDVRVSGETPYANQQAMAVRDDWPILVDILQKALDAIPRQDRDVIFNRWMSIKYETAVDYTLLWEIVAGALLVVGIILYWNRKLALEIGQRRKVERQMRNRDELLSAAADVAGMAYWELDIPSLTFTFNNSFYRLMKTSVENEGGYELSSDRYFSEFCHPDSLSEIKTRLEHALQTDREYQDRFEYKAIRKDGVVQDVLVDYRVQVDERGNPVKAIGSHIDITERKKAEQDLHIAKAAIERAADGFVMLDVEDGRIIMANKQASIYTNYQMQELTGKRIWELDTGLTEEEWPTFVSDIIKAQNLRFETRMRQKGGYEFPVEVSTSYLKLGDEERVVGFFKDIIERKKSERLLRESDERFQQSLNFANIGAWDWDIGTGDLHWSSQISPMFGYSEDIIESSYEAFMNAVHPDDRDRLQEAVDACVEQGREYEIEHRVVWPDGTVRWLLERGDVVRGDDGKPQHMLGVVQDITQRKLAQEELQRKSEELAGFNEAMVDREARMIELKEEINRLSAELGHEVPYPQVWRE